MYYQGDPEQLKKEKKLLELRVVYEAVAEKSQIMVGPVLAHLLNEATKKVKDDDDAAAKNMKPGMLFEIMGIYLGAEEAVDMLGLVIMARFSIYALRVRPQVRARNTLMLGLLMACAYGFIKMAALGAA